MSFQSINQPNNHRWFIWTIVFLLMSGVALVSYIMITDINYDAELTATFIQNPRHKSE